MLTKLKKYLRKPAKISEDGLPPADSSVYYTNDLMKYYNNLQVGINCAICNPAYVEIGSGVIMAHHSSITAVIGYNGVYYQPSITIGSGTQIGPYNAFAAINKIQIGSYVLFGPHIHVNDHSHGYEDINIPIMHQPAFSKGPIVIEDGCWIGFGSHILSGVTIGKNSVVGANSLVTRDIPPYSIAVGSPAIVIKQYDINKKQWVRV